MSELQKSIAAASAELARLEAEYAEHQKNALAHETEARQIRNVLMAENKRQRGELATALRHQQALAATETAQAAAVRAQAAAEANERKAAETLASAEKLKADLETQLAAAVAASAKPAG